MNDNNRIDYNGLSEDFICHQLDLLSVPITEDNILEREREDFINACYRLFFEREAEAEGMAAHIKLLDSGMSKPGMLYYFSETEEFQHRFELKNINYYKKDYLKYQWDVSGVLQYDGWQFVEHCFRDLLNRMPDETGMFSYTKLLYEGMPKEGIVYLFISSEEIKNVKGIRNVEYYKKIYDEYMNYVNSRGIRRRIKNLLEKITKSRQIYAETQANFAVEMLRENALEQRLARIEKGQELHKVEQIYYLEKCINVKCTELQKSLEVIDSQLDKLEGINKHLETTENENSEIVRKEVEALRFELRALDSRIVELEKNSRTTVQGYKGGVTCVQVGQFLMGIPSEEWRLAMYLSRYGAFEYGTETCFCNIIKEDMTVLDVGANLGIFTLHALSKGCNVYSYEPTPNTYHLLYENIWVNGFVDSEKVHLKQSAIGAAKGECNFTTYSDVCGHNSMFGEQKDNSEVITVPVVALDEEFEPGTRIDVIKIDVEGAEPLVFEGMQRIIRENMEIKIFMEFAPEHLRRAGYVPKEFLEDIENMGLNIQIINESNGELLKVEKEEVINMISVNLLISH